MVNIIASIIFQLILTLFVVWFFSKQLMKFIKNDGLRQDGNLLRDWIGNTSEVDDFIDNLLKEEKKEKYFLKNLEVVTEKIFNRNYTYMELRLIKSYLITAEKSLGTMSMINTLIAFIFGMFLQILSDPLKSAANNQMDLEIILTESPIVFGFSFFIIFLGIVHIYKRTTTRTVIIKEIIDIVIDCKKIKEDAQKEIIVKEFKEAKYQEF